MTDKQNAQVYEDYTAAMSAWRALPPAQQKSTPIPAWDDSVKKLGLDPESLKKAKADLAAAQQELAAAEGEKS